MKEQNLKKFLVDEMLGEVARWLRLLGYDADYLKDVTDQELINRSKRDGRVLLTSDQELQARATKEGIHSLLLQSGSVTSKLVALAKAYKLDLCLNPTNSRCPICNGKVREVCNTKELNDSVPSKVLDKNDEFWVCTKCNKVYWVGGHWKNITRTINEVKDLLREQLA
ncbi:MAG: Mut7-C RNAse domain-containing protein [Promethearchaeati archaeon SRVP18_Atabeyarchaeia-1]